MQTPFKIIKNYRQLYDAPSGNRKTQAKTPQTKPSPNRKKQGSFDETNIKTPSLLGEREFDKEMPELFLIPIQ